MCYMFNFKHSVIFSALALSLTACGGSDDKNTAPYNITLSNDTVVENQAGVSVGTLSATDDQGDSVTFALASGADTRFEINGNTLKLAADQSLDYEPKGTPQPEITLPIIVSDGELEKEETLVIKVTDELDYYGFYDGNGESTVSYSGQIARHLIIAELNNYIKSTLTAEVKNGLNTKKEILEKLYAFYYNPANTPADFNVDVVAVIETNPIASITASIDKTLIKDVSPGKYLQDKIAGNDRNSDGTISTDHKDWLNGDFVSFSDNFMTGFTKSPEGLLLRLFDKLADNALALQQSGGDGAYYVTPEGLDLQQLIQKFLLGAVAFQQGSDDYLDDGKDGKGLKASNAIVDGKFYSNLEHQWDEGFGYFGAARDYLSYTDDELASSTPYMDTDGDEKIDLNSEYNFGNSTNAAKRDLKSAGTTDLTKDAMEGFLKGRALINANVPNELTSAQMTELQGYRTQAVLAWEKSISATVIHYINKTIADLNNINDGVPTADLAKHWSELKGFLLGLQFNPASPLSDADFVAVNNLVGDQPDFSVSGKASYITGLETARTTLQGAYGFTVAFDAD